VGDEIPARAPVSFLTVDGGLGRDRFVSLEPTDDWRAKDWSDPHRGVVKEH